MNHLFKTLLLIALIPGIAFAAGTGKPAAIWWPMINFTLYFCLMSYVYRSKIKPALNARKEKLILEMQAAGREIAEAEEELRIVQERFSSLEVEKSELKKRYANEVERVTEEVVKNAESEARQIAVDVERQIENELRAAKASIRNRMIKEASSRARNNLEQTLNDEKDATLRAKALEQF